VLFPTRVELRLAWGLHGPLHCTSRFQTDRQASASMAPLRQDLDLNKTTRLHSPWQMPIGFLAHDVSKSPALDNEAR